MMYIIPGGREAVNVLYFINHPSEFHVSDVSNLFSPFPIIPLHAFDLWGVSQDVSRQSDDTGSAEP